MRAKISEIANLNAQNYKFSKGNEIINYLDTSSVDKGVVLGFQKLQTEYDDIPSRAKRGVKDGTIIVSTVRPNLLHYAYLDSPCKNVVVSTGYVTIDAKTNIIDSKYLYCVLTSSYITNYLIKISSTAVSSYPSFNPDDLGNLVIDFPDKIEEQQKIARQIFSLNSKIENNNKINSELESMAKTLYDYWFLQFEFPNEEGKPYKSSGGKMVWNDELKREIPEGWEVADLMNTQLCDDIKAGVDYFEIKNYLPTANINGETITDGDNITYSNRENRANMQPLKYSVWFAKMKNSVKHLSIPENSKWFIDKYILSTGFQGLKCNQESFAYIHCIINSGWFEIYKDVLSHGATQEGVNNEDLKNVKFVVPNNRLLRLVAEQLNPVLEKKFSIIKENQELASLRDFLLPMLMNGQVTFKDEVKA